ncbi:MAG: hypothetical protein MUC56_11965 [Thermoanaerobaculales bacterium]|jgi:hypothetical protein|nr:hypothetical protein [Thermoanaerobaculales bacterium]
MERRLVSTLIGIMIGLSLPAGVGAQAPTGPASPDPVATGGDPMPAAATGVERELEAEIARLDEVADAIAGLRDELARAGETDAAETQAAIEHAAELAIGLRAAVADQRPADPIYDRAVAELGVARRRLGEAFAALSAPSRVPSYAPDLDLDSLDAARYREAVEAIRDRLAGLDEAAAAARRVEGQVRWETTERRIELVRRLNEVRVDAIAGLSPERRERVLGLSREGIAQLRRELDHIGLWLQAYTETRRHQVESAEIWSHDLFVIGAISGAVLKLALVIVVALWLRSRWRSWFGAFERWLLRLTATVPGRRRAEGVLILVEAAIPWLVFVAAVIGAKWAVGPFMIALEIQVVLEIALLYGLYRLAIALVVALTLRIAHRYGLRLAAKRRDKLIATVSWAMRLAIPILVLLLVAERVVGRGYIYHVVVRFSWLVAAAIFLGVAFAWRKPTAEAYLAAHPSGRFSDLVRRSQGRLLGVLITPVCVIWWAGHALVVVARDLALGFEQTRRALAFVFRRRIERQAEVHGYADGAVDRLPEAVCAAFTEEPVQAGPLAVDHFPGLDRLEATLASWRETGVGGPILLTGERGVGKTTWLQRIDPGGLPLELITMDERPRTATALAVMLGRRIVAEPETEWDLDRLAEALASGPQRIIALDMAQHLVLATVGGYAVFDAFGELVERTRERVFWVCAMSAFAWRHLEVVRPARALFRDRIALLDWSDESIRELIRTRVAAAGIAPNYGDLVVDRVEGVSYRARLVESEEGYARLLWDYADGNPRVALHFFLRSLVPDETGGYRVRLFREPPLESLERFDEAGLFLLAATIVHENLTRSEAAEVTRLGDAMVTVHLDRLSEVGVLRNDRGRFRVTPYWHRAAVRLLRRRNLLES